MDTTTNNTNQNQLSVGNKVRVEKGCKARGITKGSTAQIKEITPLGAEYGYMVKVTINFLNSFAAGKTFAFYARHINRLSDTFINMNDGNPLHKITVRKA